MTFVRGIREICIECIFCNENVKIHKHRGVEPAIPFRIRYSKGNRFEDFVNSQKERGK